MNKKYYLLINRVFWILIALLIFIFISIVYYRISMSNYYEKGFINKYMFSGNKILIPSPYKEQNGENHNSSIRNIVFPVNSNERFSITLSGGRLISFFGLYNVLGFKEHKPLFISGSSNTYLVDTSKKFHFWTEIGGIEHNIRNSIFDQGGKLEYIIMGVMPLLPGDIEVSKKQFNTPAIISEITK